MRALRFSTLLAVNEGLLIHAPDVAHFRTCREYLFSTVHHLEEFGIRDRNLWRLQEIVADEIRSMHGRKP
ncbi:hypothetical protein X772_09800 [Mesorhizobium sp. LSJC280B00]|nr:hypothetical protein X772_09800 [Mesorhizobium sp. LSJC280B00]